MPITGGLTLAKDYNKMLMPLMSVAFGVLIISKIKMRVWTLKTTVYENHKVNFKGLIILKN